MIPDGMSLGKFTEQCLTQPSSAKLLTLSPKMGQSAEWETLGALSLKWDVLIKSFPLRLRICVEKVEGLWESERMDVSMETASSRQQQAWYTHNSETRAACTRRAQAPARWGPALRKEKWTQAPAPNQLPYTDTKERLVFSSRVSMGTFATLSRSRWAAKLNSVAFL